MLYKITSKRGQILKSYQELQHKITYSFVNIVVLSPSHFTQAASLNVRPDRPVGYLGIEECDHGVLDNTP